MLAQWAEGWDLWAGRELEEPNALGACNGLRNGNGGGGLAGTSSVQRWQQAEPPSTSMPKLPCGLMALAFCRCFPL